MFFALDFLEIDENPVQAVNGSVELVKGIDPAIIWFLLKPKLDEEP
jgi:hypothetical protein